MEVDPDFDPTTEEGRANLDETTDENFDSLIKNDGESMETWDSKIKKNLGVDIDMRKNV